MSVGRIIDKATIDGQISSFGTQLNALFSQVQLFSLALDAMTDAALTGLGYSAGDIATLRSAYRDVNKLRQVYAGTMYVAPGATSGAGVPTANDGTHFGYPFIQFVSQVSGLGY